MMNALLISSGLPQNLWGEAILTANQILNRVPHSKTNVIPYEKWKGRKSNLKYFIMKRPNNGPLSFWREKTSAPFCCRTGCSERIIRIAR